MPSIHPSNHPSIQPVSGSVHLLLDCTGHNLNVPSDAARNVTVAQRKEMSHKKNTPLRGCHGNLKTLLSRLQLINCNVGLQGKEEEEEEEEET